MTATPRGVDDDDVSATQSVVNMTDKNLFLSRLPTSVKQEMVNEDSVNHTSDGGVQFPGQETVNEDSVHRISDGGIDLPRQEMVSEDAESSETPNMEECVGVRETGPPGRCTSL